LINLQALPTKNSLPRNNFPVPNTLAHFNLSSRQRGEEHGAALATNLTTVAAWAIAAESVSGSELRTEAAAAAATTGPPPLKFKRMFFNLPFLLKPGNKVIKKTTIILTLLFLMVSRAIMTSPRGHAP
jgi:hypothetical protein